ncbi:hypothetical protein Lbir_0784 [Legionella birminghamensis]|uniref:Uncharacterized protein n=1 Tax=Legionella birminghamensis TaxID=28083 RepID=A0A378IC92_9GAMM|nr:hypothetical protein [Legionella birminghamensis]KTC74504.1 hypothetical protein Lbir_0784 [Legionella birminghamensis]STX32633.1 Uncharacterised protein [Legionella birminghamensis]
MYQFKFGANKAEEQQSILARTTLSGDKKAYVERDASSRLFRAVVEDVPLYTEKRHDPAITVKFANGSLQIELKASEDPVKAESEFKEFRNFIASLSNDSHNNKFYLGRADFFVRQCKDFEKSLLNRAERKADRDVQSSHYQEPGSYSC